MVTRRALITEVDRALREAGPTADCFSPASWRLKHAGLPGGATHARMTDDWLRLTATVDRWSHVDDDEEDAREHHEWELLRLNARLPISVRCALDPMTHQPCLCVDLRLDDEGAIARRICEACDGLVAANDVLVSQVFRSGSTGDLTANDAQVSHVALDAHVSNDAGMPAQLSRVFDDAGWPVSSRDNQQVVQIDGSPERTIAVVHVHPDGGLRLDTALVSAGEPGVVRTAIARCLLAVTGTVRGVRASVQRASDAVVVSLELGWVSAPCASDLRSGLTALSIAWSWCQREVRALQDPRVAEAYLALFATRCLDGDDIRAAV